MVLGRRKRRNGEFPPNPTQWDAERAGLTLRRKFDVPSDAPLRPFSLQFDGVYVLSTRKQVEEFVDASLCRKLFGAHRRSWSGMTIPVDDEFVIMVNETHPQTRKNATLMEEHFHVLLGHKPCRIFICPTTGLMRREYDKQTENEAYFASAASLVPYCALKEMVHGGGHVTEIAEHFEVSRDLVSFRLKTCKLYRRAIQN
jgi:Zn-dependent peptidase ImmA (M78 family)